MNIQNEILPCLILRRKLLPGIGILLSLLFSPQAWSADTDIFTANSANSGIPNLLFIIDNSSSWNGNIGAIKKYELEHEALYNAIMGIIGDTSHPDYVDATTTPIVEINVGIMTFASSANPKGGKVISAVQKLTTAYQTTLKDLLYVDGSTFGVRLGQENLGSSNTAPYALTMNEAYLYFGGLSVRAGTADGDHDPAAVSAGTYVSPITVANACGNNNIIVVGNGGADNGEDNNAESLLDALSGVFPGDPLTLSPKNDASNWADEWARYLYATDVNTIVGATQNIKTYVIDVFDSSVSQNKPFLGKRAWFKSIAKQGSGAYFTGENAAEVATALNQIIEEILAVNTVYASTTLPVSVNVRGTNLNQVYMGVFRPDPDNKARWFGNLKLYKLGVDASTNTVRLEDQNDNPAFNASTGFIDFGAKSHWTHSSSFWDFSPRGTGIYLTGSDSPDGEIVEKGGAAQQLRDDGHAARSIYTCTGACASGSSLASTPFNDSNISITEALLNVTTAAERTTLINWVRGEDNLEDEDSDGSYTDTRAALHGDVLHSKPAVINYNRTGDDKDIIVFYGGNDGALHAIKGGTDSDRGHELWAFIPQEFFGDLKTLYDNDLQSVTPKPYFFDGTVGFYIDDGNDGVISSVDKAYIYLTARRGGELLYALDVTVPESPKMLWKKTNASSGYGELGQTWSSPKLVTVKAHANPVIIMGGGYDETVDDDPSKSLATKGAAIFAIDAFKGNMLWQVGKTPTGPGVNLVEPSMLYSIPSDVSVLDRDLDGYHDRVYVGDTGGTIWRVDMDDHHFEHWQVHTLADVGPQTFLYPPDVVYSGDSTGTFDAVLLGSGDREDPFNNTTQNYFFMFKDRKVGNDGSGQVPILSTKLYDITDNKIQTGTDAEKTTALAALDAARGWKLTLGGKGEKVVGSAITLNGIINFSTNTPGTAATCTSDLGIAKIYQISPFDGTAKVENDGVAGINTADRYGVIEGGGLLPSPVPAIVEINGNKYEVVLSGPNVGVVDVPGSAALEAREPTFWFNEHD